MKYKNYDNVLQEMDASSAKPLRPKKIMLRTPRPPTIFKEEPSTGRPTRVEHCSRLKEQVDGPASHRCSASACQHCQELNEDLDRFELRLRTRFAAVAGLEDELLIHRKPSFTDSPLQPAVSRAPAKSLAEASVVLSRRLSLPTVVKQVAPPVFGLLLGITPPMIRRKFEEFCTTTCANVAGLGMTEDDFSAFLQFLVPHVTLSYSYTDQMFSTFEAEMKEGINRLQFPAFLRAYGKTVSHPDIEKSVQFFFSALEDKALGLLPMEALKSSTVLNFASREAHGIHALHWMQAARAIDEDEDLQKLHSFVAEAVAPKKGRKWRTKHRTTNEPLLKRTLSFSPMTAIPGAVQVAGSILPPYSPLRTLRSISAVGETATGGLTLDDLRLLVYGSSVLYAAFRNLSFTRPGEAIAEAEDRFKAPTESEKWRKEDPSRKASFRRRLSGVRKDEQMPLGRLSFDSTASIS